MARPKGSKNRVSTDTMEAFAERIIRRLAEGSAETSSLERIVCRLLVGKDQKVAALMACKVVEWKYGKPKPQENEGGVNVTFAFDAPRPMYSLGSGQEKVIDADRVQ